MEEGEVGRPVLWTRTVLRYHVKPKRAPNTVAVGRDSAVVALVVIGNVNLMDLSLWLVEGRTPSRPAIPGA